MRVDIFSDPICPWCYLGRRRLQRALREEQPAIAAEIHWRAFQLNPDMPAEGVDRHRYLEAKFGPRGLADAEERLRDAGRQDGIAFAFEAIARTPNTLAALRLLRRAGRERLQDALAEALFHGYFEQGRDIGDHAVLAELAAGVGMAADGLRGYLAGEEDRDDVEQEDAFARQIGITGVPCFIIDQRLAVVGAQSPEYLRTAFAQAQDQPAAR